MYKSAPLYNACLEAMDYCFGIYNDHHFIYDEMEFEFYVNPANTPSAFKQIIFNVLVFAADMLLSL